jgi:hypothetical protein
LNLRSYEAVTRKMARTLPPFDRRIGSGWP